MKVYAVMVESSEVRGRDSLEGLAATLDGAKAVAQARADQRNDEHGRRPIPLKWREDYGVWRAEEEVFMDSDEFFVVGPFEVAR